MLIPHPTYRIGSSIRHLFLLGLSCYAIAATYPLPTGSDTVVGTVHVIRIRNESTLLDVMRHYDVGFDEITSVNPGVSIWTPDTGASITVPTRFALPPKPWTDIVINISQRRLFYFPPTKRKAQPVVITYPISIAREGWATPLGSTRITAKFRDPAWFVPDSIRAEHLREEGVELPEYFPPGPNNPMGMLALQTGFPGIYIHATNHPWGVGMRTSHGCIHLYPEDEAELFPLIERGTRVRVIDMPAVLGRANEQWTLATYAPVSEYANSLSSYSRALIALMPVLEDMRDRPYADLDWTRVATLAAHPQPVPEAITPGQPSQQDIISKLPVEDYTLPSYGPDANSAALPSPEP